MKYELDQLLKSHFGTPWGMISSPMFFFDLVIIDVNLLPHQMLMLSGKVVANMLLSGFWENDEK